eukprot:1192785-Prorocentrum_minimum.AAC.2
MPAVSCNKAPARWEPGRGGGRVVLHDGPRRAVGAVRGAAVRRCRLREGRHAGRMDRTHIHACRQQPRVPRRAGANRSLGSIHSRSIHSEAITPKQSLGSINSEALTRKHSLGSIHSEAFTLKHSLRSIHSEAFTPKHSLRSIHSEAITRKH